MFCNCGNCRVNVHKTHQIKRYAVSLGVRGLRDVLTELENNDTALIEPVRMLKSSSIHISERLLHCGVGLEKVTEAGDGEKNHWSKAKQSFPPLLWICMINVAENASVWDCKHLLVVNEESAGKQIHYFIIELCIFWMNEVCFCRTLNTISRLHTCTSRRCLKQKPLLSEYRTDTGLISLSYIYKHYFLFQI